MGSSFGMMQDYRQQMATPGLIAQVPQGFNSMSSPLERLRRVSEVLKGYYSLEALLELSAYGRSLEAEHKEHGIPAPKWLPESLRALKAAIAETWRREREEELRKAEAELEELKSKEEKRVAKAAEVEKLRKELGYGEE